MPNLDHTAFVNSCRDERGVGHQTLRAYAQDLRTFARSTQDHHLADPLSKDDILAYHRHLRDELDAKPATIERRLVTLKSYFAWRADRDSALPSPFTDVRISVRIPRRLSVFARIMMGLAEQAPDNKTISIDATYLKAHLTASSLR